MGKNLLFFLILNKFSTLFVEKRRSNLTKISGYPIGKAFVVLVFIEILKLFKELNFSINLI